VSRSVTHQLRRIALTGLAVAALTTGNIVTQTTTAHAAPRATPVASQATSARITAPAARAARMRGYRIVAAARAQQGKPYRFGARGPNAFDCSGLSGFAYRQAHLTLPRTTDDQYHAARRITRAAARPGDLVFWVRGGHAYHVGIYAGNGRVWHAPKPGSRVKLASIFSPGEVHFGRVGS
jgi:cell wall-associated NlpC family hydrolase